MICLGIDIGGTGCKCVAFREDGEQLALSYREYPIPSGTVNLPPDCLRDSVFEVIADCVKEINGADVAAITVSSFGESFVAIDKDGAALGDILLYFADSASRDFDAVVEKVGAERFMEITRIAPDPSYSLSKMLYTLKTAPRPVYKFLFIASYVNYCLTGKAICDDSLACRSLLYDVKTRAWSDELIHASGVDRATLPEVMEAGSVCGTVLPDVAKRMGISENVRVIVGCHDQIVNALGAGVADIGDAVDTSGTCECITPLFAEIPDDLTFQRDNYACVPYLENRGYVTYAYNISAGSVVRWYRNALAESLRAEAEARGMSIYDILNEQCPAEPTKLMLLPFLQGMGGTPEIDINATGVLAGLTTQTRLPDIYRAVLEGVTFEMKYNQERLDAGNVRFDRLLACGGGAKSAVWLQIKADILNCEIVPVLREETGAMGSAILGFASVLNKKPIEVAKRFWRYAEPIRPNPEHVRIYAERYNTYKKLRELAKEL